MRIFVIVLLTAVAMHAQEPTPTPQPWADWEREQQQFTREAIEKMPAGEAKDALMQLFSAEGQARRDALADFRTGAAFGITVTFTSDDHIEDARVVNDRIIVTRRADEIPRAMLEVHHLLTANIFRAEGRARARSQLTNCQASPVECPMWGAGPFAALQFGDDDGVSSVGIGIMLGIRSDPRKDNSFNIGLGVVWDGSVKTLAQGFHEGQPLPEGETDVRFEERSGTGLMLGLSFAF